VLVSLELDSVEKNKTEINAKEVLAVVSEGMSEVNHVIHAQMTSEVPLVEKIANYIIASGGKRLRPVLVLMTAGALNEQNADQYKLATVIEFLHTATLLHDDVVDESDLRRGQQTANLNWGNAPTILVGDFLYSRAFQLLVALGNMEIMEILGGATNRIAEGEVLQLVNVGNPDIDEAAYMKIIQGKTAELFSAATAAAAVIAGSSKAVIKNMHDYGMHLGIAFQLIDDVLDYQGDAGELGKNVGDDLAEGKPTLPLIYAMEHTDSEMRKMIRKCIRDGGLDKLDTVLVAITECGALQYTIDKAEYHAQQARDCLNGLPENAYTQALKDLTVVAVQRKS
jgi:octaprenyl-diphosphate synthase